MTSSTVTEDMVKGGKLACGCDWYFVPDYPDEGHVAVHANDCAAGYAEGVQERASDWAQVEDVLQTAARGSSEPFYSETQVALGALFRLGSTAKDALAWRGRAHVAETIQGELRSEVQRATEMLARQLWITDNDLDVRPGESCMWDVELLEEEYEQWREEAAALIEKGPEDEPRDRGAE